MDSISIECQARRMENQGNWVGALGMWKKVNRKSDIEAVEMIIEANRKGDRYRELTAGVVEDWEKRKLNNRELHEKLEAAHNRVYRNT